MSDTMETGGTAKPTVPRAKFSPASFSSYDASGETWIHPVRSDGSEVPWCLISDTATLLVDGSVQQVQQYHGRGDPYWK